MNESGMTSEELSRATREVRLALLKEQLETERREKPWWRRINLPVFVPVMSALIAGLVAIFGNLRAESARLENELEIARFEREANLILEVSKGGKEDALRNLEWLIDAGLVTDGEGRIRALIGKGRSLSGSYNIRCSTMAAALQVPPGMSVSVTESNGECIFSVNGADGEN